MEPNFPIDNFSSLYQYAQPIQRAHVYVNNCGGMMTVNNAPQQYDVNLQQQMINLKDELRRKNEEIATLKAENSRLKMQLAEKEEVINSDWNLITTCNELDNMFERFNRFKCYYEDLFKNIDPNCDGQDRIPSKSPDVLAIMDGLYHAKGGNKFNIEANQMLSRTPEKLRKEIIQYINSTDYDAHLATIYSKVVGSQGHPNYNLMLSLLVSNHVFKRKKDIDLSQVIDLMSIKHNNDLDSNVSNIKVDFCDGVIASDYIYRRHSISGIQLSMLHAFSHMDYSIKGTDIAEYHVGRACHISECSIIELLDENNVVRFFKPIKCSKEYVILPRLPNEKNYRVEAILHRNGMTPITLVRTLSNNFKGQLVMGPISQEINGLMNKVRLSKFEYGFSEEGLCISAVGELSLCDQRELDYKRKNCCNRAFRYNGNVQRRHKELK